MKHLHPDAIARGVFALLVTLQVTLFPTASFAQCPSPCSATSFNEGGTITPISNSVGSVSVGSGTYINVNVHNGGRYILSHCSTASPFGTTNTQLSLFNYASGSACVDYSDNPGGTCANRAQIDYTPNYNGVLQLQSNRSSCLGYNGTSGALTYQCLPPGDTTVYGNGYWNLYAWNAGDASGGSGAWSSGYSGYLQVNSLSFNTTSYWPVLNSPSIYSGYLGCEIGNDNHSWSAKRTGFDCGVYRIDVNNHDDLLQVIVNGVATTLTGASGTLTTAYTGVLDNSSLVVIRCSEGTGNSNAQITITNITSALSAGSIGSDQTLCSAADPALLTSTGAASGGATPYTYNWYSQTNCTGAGTSLGVNNTVYNPPAGLTATTCYYRTVTDACGDAVATSPVTVTVNQPPTAASIINASPSGTVCNPTTVSLGVSTGSTGTGGAWTWYATTCGVGVPIGTGPSINVTPSATTTYFVRAEGSGPCTYPTACTQRTVTVNQPSVAPTSLTASPATSCAGGNVTLTVNGGSLGTGANYVWYQGGAGCGLGVQISSGTATSITVNPSSTTTYWVRAEGPAPCPASTLCATATVVVNTNSTAPTGITTSTDTICNGAGSSTLTVQGGFLGTGANWVWYAGGCGLGASVGSGPSIVVSPSTTTTYFVRAETGGGNPCSAPTGCVSKEIFVKQNSTPASSVSGNTLVCNGISTTLSVLGGSLGWGAEWVWYSGNCGGTFVGTGSSVTVSPSTTTTYFVRAEGQCNTTSCVFATVTVNDTSQPATSISGPAYICTGNSTNLTVVGGLLGTGANWRWYSGSCGGTLEGTGSVLPVAPTAGTTYFVQAIGLCNTTICTQFTLPVNPLPQGNISGTTSICEGGSTNITFNFTVGTGPYDIIYTDGTSSFPLNGVNNGDIVTVTPGGTTTYQFTSVTDALGCTRTTLFGGAATVTVTPLPDINSVAATEVFCNGDSTGSITIIASNGTPQLNYSIDGGVNTQTSNVFNNLPAGFYNIVVIDAQGCQRALQTPVEVTEPTPLVQTSTPTNASCANVFDGKIDVLPSGGVLPYSYSLNGGPTQAGSQFTGLAAGDYITYVYDGNGCVATDTITINNSYAITSAIDSQYNVSCFGGSDGLVIVELSGGTPAYSYSINGSIFTPSPIFTGLSAATYVVTLRDSKGCTDFLSVTITQPTQLSVNIDSVRNVGCNGASSGAVFITASGGTAPYTFLWSNGNTLEDADTLIAGTYTVTITDSKGCTTFGSATVSQPIPLFVSVASYKDLKCYNDSSGTIDVTVNGGVPPYSYLWNNGATTEDLANLDSATYTLTVTDVNGCQQVVTQAIDQPNILASTISQSPVTCNGLSDGDIDLTVTGGTGPYSYFWNNGATIEDLTNVPAGNYNVLITDAKGCATTNSTTVTQPNALILTTSVTNVLCNGGNNGAIDLTVTGGAGNNTFLWSTAAITEDVSGLVAGVYTVQVTDQNGCTATVSATVAQPASALSATADSTDVTCFGANNGRVNVTVSGGTQPYGYLWSNGANTEDIAALGPGTYTLTITDANGCGFTITSTVNEPPVLAASIVPTPVSCNGGNNGAADLTVTGGNPNYTYLWNNFATTEDISGLTAGNYTVIVTDSKNCQVIATTTITQLGAINLTGVVTNVSCYAGSDGQIQITAMGGTNTYTYLWSNTSTVEDQTGLTSGNYIVIATDGNSCTASASFTVTQPDTLTVSGIVANVNCNGNANGAVNITVAGGTTAYTYLWSNGATTQDLTGLSGGTFDVTVTDSKGCVATGTYTVNEPSAITSSITPTHVTCIGFANGAADLSVIGGTSPYSYLWSNFSSNEDVSGLSGGNYFVIITDANGCTKRDSVTINEPAALAVSTTVTNVLCFGGNNGVIDLNVSGGITAYTYLWSNGATADSIFGLTAGVYSVTVTDANGCTVGVTVTITQPAAPLAATAVATDVTCFGYNNGSANLTVSGGTTAYAFAWSNGATTEDISALGPNTYTVTVTDANGCVTVTSATVNEPFALTASITPTPVSCFGGNDGEADLTVGGGNPGYTYLWSNFATTQDISGLTAGNYVVIVTDTKGCSVTAGTTITQPNQISITGAVVNVQCNGGSNGSINLTVLGGAGGYTFVWSNGATSQSISILTAGGYSVTVTDANLCEASASFTVTEPAALTLSGDSEDVTCNGLANGAVNITVAGGITPYTYLWSNGATTQDINGLNGGTFTVTVTDGNGCNITGSYTVNEPTAITSSIAGTNVTCAGSADGEADLTVNGGVSPYTFLWSTFQNTEDLTGLSGGTYYVIVKDANGCEKRDSIVIDEPAAITIAVSDTDVLCNGAATGAINITVNGGTPTITYLWTNGATSEDLSALSAGTYSVTTTDGNGCTASASATITQPAALVLNSTVTNVGCAGGANGEVDVTVQGGVFPYSFAWSNGATTEDINNVSGGTYTVTITDDNGCIITASFTVNEPTAITSTIVPTHLLCNGVANGEVDLTVSGGTPPYTFLWSNFSGNEDLTGLSGGQYVVIITDANGCTRRDSVTINEPAAITIAVSDTDVLCNGGTTGAIDITVNGGTPTIIYLWSNGATTEDLSALAAGTYSVTITDGNGCTASASVTITQPAALVLNATTTDVGCAGGANGAVDITVQGGVFPYTFAWSNGAITEDINNVSGGTYTVTVTDDNGCTATASFTVNEPAALTSSIVPAHLLCNGTLTGAADLTVSGGTGPYNFLWSNFAGTEDLTAVAGGYYVVIITDANGCIRRDSTIINEPTAITIATLVTDVSCNGGNDGEVDVTVTGGTPGYTYLWSNGATTDDLTGLTIGTYTLTVTDANACTATVTITITQPSALLVTGTSTNVSCNGGNNGTINTSVSGGVAPYTFAWSNGGNTEDLTALAAGTYSVTVSDANLCTSVTAFTLTEPTAITSSIAGTDVDCNGAANGAADLTVGGGVAPYSFLWNLFQTTEDLNNLSGGTYYVIITDANGCTHRDSIVIGEPTKLVLSATSTNILCNGSNDGTIDLTVAGGTPNYTYLWSNGANTEDLSGLNGGIYTVTVTDANGCTATLTVVITQPVVLVVTGNGVNVSCFGGNNGSVNINVSGGTAPYFFNWNNGETSEDIYNLGAGIYAVTVSDVNGCTDTASFTLTAPTGMTSTVSTVDVSCQGANNGSADLTVSGGTPPYAFLWSNFQGSEDIANLDGGIYYVLITDDNGCTHRDSAIILEPSPLILSTVVVNVSCFNANDGSVDLTVQGGTQPYQYAWSNGATTQDLSGLAGGTYVVTVTDNHGCTAQTSVIIVNPSPITANHITKNTLCFGDANGSIDLIPTGGTPNFSFLWSNGATSEDINGLVAGLYVVTITDSRNCIKLDSVTITEPGPLFTSGFVKNVSCYGKNDGCLDITAYGGTLPYAFAWSTGQSTEDICSLDGGDYYVTVTDANGCQVISLYVIVEPDSLGVTLSATNVSCFGGTNGTVSAVPSGGTHPFEYLWSDFVVDSFRTNIGAGLYVIMLTDSNGCHLFDSIRVTEPTALQISGIVTNANCFGSPSGGIDVTVTGGTATYSYSWSNGAATEDLTQVVAGTYTLTVTDANLCTAMATFTITQPTELILTLITDKPGCHGSKNGSVAVLASQGVPPYSYVWNTAPPQTNATAEDLGAGTYTVTVVDDNGCSAEVTQVLSQPDSIEVTTTATNAKCFGSSSGAVEVFVTGGVSPFVYELNGIAQATGSFSNLQPGNYLVVVNDINGCEGRSQFTISAPSQVQVDLTATQQVILTGMQTQLIASATSTLPIIGYSWMPDSLFDFSNCANAQDCNNPLVAPRTTTIFTVTAYNSDSCSASDTITIYVNNEASAFIPTAFTPNNDDLNDRFEFDILGATNLDVSIFNRWGEKFFSNEAQQNGFGHGDSWDGTKNGKACPEDTYVYRIVVTYFNGETKNIEGTVTLMR